jgi:hypothetical protein
MEVEMDALSERLIADFACLDPVYVDDMAGVLNLGTNFQMLFHRWSPRSDREGGVGFEKIPALSLILPRTSILARNGLIASLLNMQAAPQSASITELRDVTHH